uniref:Ig-like domain-containing protein n=1 Tax=Myripristis murdjan TaxID=586833 RepID=A0A667WV02_9TELE
MSTIKKPSIGQKPTFLHPITSCTVPHGEVARFHACVSGMPKPEIGWFHNQQPVKPTKNIVFHFDEMTNTATLIIVDAFSEHAGLYTCKAANNAGEAVCSATLTVTKEEGNFQSVLEGDPATLKCKLVACPPPTILWFHNNRPIHKERRRRICMESRMHMHTSSLVIDSIKEKDSGSYKVMAINTEGSADSTASLLVSLREEQSANYLSFVRRSARAHESIDSIVEQRKERKFRVDLRCVGSPFDKMSKVHQGRSRSKTALVRTVYFRSASPHPLSEWGALPNPGHSDHER